MTDQRERAVLVGLAHSGAGLTEAESSLEELALLADTAGADVLERVIQVRDTPEPATYVGKGKAREVIELATALHADAIIFDDELAPAQGRNLEDLAGVNPLAPSQLKILDRTGLILDVFAQHAHSAEGKLQVELAKLNYDIPRLRGWGDVLSRMGGGIGTRRGPGETKLEVDRRRIRRRLAKVRADLGDVERTREIKRNRRVRSGVPQISLVGYTNSGKSTLLNALTGAGPGSHRPPPRAPGRAPGRAHRHGRVREEAAAHPRGGVPVDAGGDQLLRPAAARRRRRPARSSRPGRRRHEGAGGDRG